MQSIIAIDWQSGRIQRLAASNFQDAGLEVLDGMKISLHLEHEFAKEHPEVYAEFISPKGESHE